MHCLFLTGSDIDENGIEYFQLQETWGKKYGDDEGFIKMERHKCLIKSVVVFEVNFNILIFILTFGIIKIVSLILIYIISALKWRREILGKGRYCSLLFLRCLYFLQIIQTLFLCYRKNPNFVL